MTELELFRADDVNQTVSRIAIVKRTRKGIEITCADQTSGSTSVIISFDDAERLADVLSNAKDVSE